MAKKFNSVEERRAYWRQWYENNKHREDYKKKDKATKYRIRKEKREWFIEYRKLLKCEISDWRVLDFHHIDPTQKLTEVTNLVQSGKSKEKIMNEISKCKVLCANCHRIEHYEEKLIEHKV